MLIGFGSTEKKYEEDFEAQLFGKAEELLSSCEHNYFDDNLIAEFEKYVKVLAQKSKDEADSYKTDPNHPDRYTTVWPYVLGDCNYLMVKVTFHHVNRKHGLSPDGWAMMKSERCFAFDTWEAGREKRQSVA